MMINTTRLFIAILFLHLFLAGTAMATEQPKYEITQQDNDIELRTYAPMIIAKTYVSGAMDEASSKGFKLIADYIFGNNLSVTQGETAEAKENVSEKIAMTAPVKMEQSSEKISMTTPVSMQKEDDKWLVSFVMPSEYSLATLPKPNNPLVIIEALPAKKYAAITFSGLASESKVESKTAELEAWMATANISATSVPELARYNPPWTLPFLRRNEILIAY